MIQWLGGGGGGVRKFGPSAICVKDSNPTLGVFNADRCQVLKPSTNLPQGVCSGN